MSLSTPSPNSAPQSPPCSSRVSLSLQNLEPPTKWDERRTVHAVDYDRGERTFKTQLSGLGRDAIPARYRLRVDRTRFQKDWKLSEVVDRVLSLRKWEDIDGVLNSWIGRFARKNFPLLIKEITAAGSLEHAVEVFRWMKNQKNYCARSDIYNMLIQLHARHNQIDQARGLFFEMQEWRYSLLTDNYY